MSPFVALYLLIPAILSAALWAFSPPAPVKLLGTLASVALLPILFILPMVAEPGQDFDHLLLAIAAGSFAASLVAVALGIFAGKRIAGRLRPSA